MSPQMQSVAVEEGSWSGFFLPPTFSIRWFYLIHNLESERIMPCLSQNFLVKGSGL